MCLCVFVSGKFKNLILVGAKANVFSHQFYSFARSQRKLEEKRTKSQKNGQVIPLLFVFCFCCGKLKSNALHFPVLIFFHS